MSNNLIDLGQDISHLKITPHQPVDLLQIKVAIFDLMSDKQKRTVTEVEDALAELGYNRRDINQQMVGMLYKNRTFVAAPRGPQGANAYVMKKHAQRPHPLGVSSLPAPEPEVIQVESKPAYVPATEPVPEPAQEIVSVAPAMPQALVVELTDPVKVAIWKVMQDFAPYTVADLQALLDHINPWSVKSHMKAMADADMFHITKGPARTAYTYVLKADAPMPENQPAYSPNYDLRKPVEPAVQIETKPQPPEVDPRQHTFTPHWEARLGALEEYGHEVKAERTLRAEQDRRDAEVRLKLQNDARQAFGETEALVSAEEVGQQSAALATQLDAIGLHHTTEAEAAAKREAEAEQAQAEREAAAEKANLEAEQPQRRIEMEAQAKDANAPRVAAPELVSVGGIFIKGRRFSFRDAMTILEELEATGFDDAEIQPDMNNAGRKFVQIEVRLVIAGMDFTVAEAKTIAQQLKKDLN